MPNVDRNANAPELPIMSACAVCVAVAVAAFAPSAYGQRRDRTVDLNLDRGWPAGTIRQQLDQDATMVPFGKGAIFVPAMTDPLDEPPVSVWQEETVIAAGTTGRRIVVMPGDYTVEMGTGAVKQRFSVTVAVRELSIAVVPVTWAGLAVHMVDETLNSVRGSYEIIRVDNREYIDVGFGADEQAGEPVTTWILRPGLYKIVRVGETYRARRDFATVRLVAGRLTDFLLVVDEATGDFKGAGEVPREELFLAGTGNLSWSFIFGGDVNMSSSINWDGSEEGESFSFRAFLDTKLTAKIFDSPLLLKLQVEEGGNVIGSLFPRTGGTGVRKFPWLKTQDRAKLDALYVYKLFPWLGPYLNFNAQTNLIEKIDRFDEFLDEGDVVRVKVYETGTDPTTGEDVDVWVRDRKLSDHVRSLPSFGLITMTEGAGINLRLFKAIFGETSVRAGLGARQLITRGLIKSTGLQTCAPNPISGDLPAGCVGPEAFVAFYKRVPTDVRVGIEATILATLRLTRWVLIRVEAYTLIPFDDIGSLVIDIESTLALKLTSFVSINYVFRYLRDPSLSVSSSTPDQFENALRLRFSLELP